MFFFWSHPRCFGSLAKFQHNIKISVKTARVSRLSVSCDYAQTICLYLMVDILEKVVKFFFKVNKKDSKRTSGWTWKIVRLSQPDPGFARRVGWVGFFFILVKVSLVPRALPSFDITLVKGKRTLFHDYRYNR